MSTTKIYLTIVLNVSSESVLRTKKARLPIYRVDPKVSPTIAPENTEYYEIVLNVSLLLQYVVD